MTEKSFIFMENSETYNVPLLPIDQKVQERHKDMRKTKWRYVILALVCYLKMCSYYITNNPGSIYQEIVQNFGISNVQFGLLYSVYNLPNIVISLLIGLLIDRIGIRVSTIIFTIGNLVGQIIFTYATFIQNYQIALIGRFLLGSCTESSSLCFIIILNIWFEGKELGFAFAVLITVAKGGISLTNFITPQIYVITQSLPACLAGGIIICTVASALSFLFSNIDSKNEKNLKRNEEIDRLQRNEQHVLAEETHSWISSTLFKQLGIKFWMFALVNFLTYFTQAPFQQNQSQFLRSRFSFEIVEAGQIQGILALVMTVFCPITGLISDRVNERIGALALANFLYMVSQTFMGLMPDCYKCSLIILPLSIYEVSMGIFISNVWAALNEIIPKRILGFSVGFINSAQNIALAFGPLAIGRVLDGSRDLKTGFKIVNFILLGINTITFFILFIWLIKQIKARRSSQ
ncbi:major facilitator superfamily protein [Stylonychia lemnae]|uniref:Lysosomal dipeptide transporter MFSD1 n=1 Tax=Stylonychia lemnae TaxID=5949 RepID=A0A078AID8_STYLE|nr:major facilitator superfamily protein [Stylonychia lemnae]|eukprot:CDW81267.1 major facilitator superfamily protein [Stylonychia lemnae]